jgi:exoribonuclease-2
MPNASQHVDLQAAAADSMRAHGFEPEFAAGSERGRRPQRTRARRPRRGIAALAWSSIDNDTSRDLDRSRCGTPAGRATRIHAIADVDAFVAGQRSTTTRPRHDDRLRASNFPMLPEALSTRATSLLESRTT